MKTTIRADKGSKRWLKVLVGQAPHLLVDQLRSCGAIARTDAVIWESPVAATGYKEFRDEQALQRLGVLPLRNRMLKDFWPRRGPQWDALARIVGGGALLVEAKAHIGEANSPPSAATPESLSRIRTALGEAREFYTPGSTALWSDRYYQYANRLAHHYFLREVNAVDSRLIFLDFINATDVNGPQSGQEWIVATQRIHAALGLPDSLERHRVYHVVVDVRDMAGLQ